MIARIVLCWHCGISLRYVTDPVKQAQASPYWEIAAGYVGAMRAEIPFTSLYSQAVSLTLDETLITIRPRSTPLRKAPQASRDSSPAYNPGIALASTHSECCVVFIVCCNGEGHGNCHRHSIAADSMKVLTMTTLIIPVSTAYNLLGLLTGLDPAAEEALGTAGSGQDPGWADYGLGQATVMDGVRLIAGGIEVVLQRLQLQVSLYVFDA